MEQAQPLVSIGIPAYNRAALLKRSIESALNQDYKNIEVIVSDNASTDDTESVCNYYCSKDSRVKYIRQPVNKGPTNNFAATLSHATGEFFMWLGDDDWIDEAYVNVCVQKLLAEPSISLASGIPQYYSNGEKLYNGKMFNLLHEAWWLRVISYFYQVADNGIFYGMMRTSQINLLTLQNKMGGDWLLIANVVSLGKAVMTRDVSVHRELGGATASYREIAAVLRISKLHAMFPMLSIAISAWIDIMIRGTVYKNRHVNIRFLVACIVFILVLGKSNAIFIRTSKRLIKTICTPAQIRYKPGG